MRIHKALEAKSGHRAQRNYFTHRKVTFMVPYSRQEQNRHKRFYAKDRVFAVVRSKNLKLKQFKNMSKGEIALAVIKSKPPKMGEVKEISRGGLSFSYIENETDLTNFDEMDILFVEKDFHLSRLPFVTIEDTVIIEDGHIDALSMKRLTVQFRGLTSHQKNQLDHVLENYTTGEVPRKDSKQVWGSRP